MGEKIRKTYYFGGWEVYFENKESTIDFLTTQGVDLEGFKFFNEAQSALEFEIEERKLVKGSKYRKDEKQLKWENLDLPIVDWKEHQVFFLEKDPEGIHRIGGPIPKDLHLPTYPDATSWFQYIGTLNCADSYFKWLNMENLHIIFPLYKSNRGIYLDYSNPSQPQIIEPTTFFNDSFEVCQVEYSQVNFKTTNVLDVNKYNNGAALLCGVPLWYQFPRVPRCPRTNDRMRFICSIKSDREITVVSTEEERDNILIFGDMSHLMLFFNPETKILFAHIEP